MANDKRKQKLQVLKRIILAILIIIAAIFLIRYYFKHYYVVESVNTPIVWEDDEIPTDSEDLSSQQDEIIQTDGILKVHMIDCGQGDSFLFEQNGKFGLIDCGTRSGGQAVVVYLQKLGVSKLQFVVGTHPHDDHMGGMYDVLSNFNCKTVYIPKVEEGLVTTQWYMKLMKKIKDDNIKVVNPKVNSKFKLGDAVFRVVGQLSPEEVGNNINNYSIVIKVSFGEMDILMTGDAETKVEEQILANSKISLDCEVLKLGHHGSDTSTEEKFLEEVDPDYGLISCEVDNKYEHPSTETMKKLKKHKVKVYRTDEQGDIVMTVTGDSISFDKKKPGSYIDGVSLSKNKGEQQ